LQNGVNAPPFIELTSRDFSGFWLFADGTEAAAGAEALAAVNRVGFAMHFNADALSEMPR
jgi:hypothetical protein